MAEELEKSATKIQYWFIFKPTALDFTMIQSIEVS